MSLPEVPRYTKGSPVVIHVPGGFSPTGLDDDCGGLEQFGFVEIRFAFPGGGRPEFHSGGEYDLRGKRSLRALADVVRFAIGDIKDSKGRSLRDIAGGKPILTSNVGLAGWSHGGNAAVVVMAEHGDEFRDLAYLATYESPFGPGAVNADLGGILFFTRDGQDVNPAYDTHTGRLQLDMLEFDPSTPTVGQAKLAAFREWGDQWIKERDPADLRMLGAFYFDMNRNGQIDEKGDFILNPTLVEMRGSKPKVPFSVPVLEEAAHRRLVKAPWPPHFMSLEEARAFWHLQDGALRMSEAIRNCPRLAVIVHGGAVDHVQLAPDHPHVLAAVKGFQAAGARFVRLNPDRAYVEWIRGCPAESAVDNSAGRHYSHQSIRSAMEPEVEGDTWEVDRMHMVAAICELADRVCSDDFSQNLDAVLAPTAPKSKRFSK